MLILEGPNLMEGKTRSEKSSTGRSVAKVLGTSAALLVVAGTVGIPLEVLGAAVIGATATYLLVSGGKTKRRS